VDEQEPQEVIAKWIKANTEHRQWYICPKCSYQAPRFRDEWVGFTQEEHQSAIWTDGSYGAGFLYAEKLLKEKNGN